MMKSYLMDASSIVVLIRRIGGLRAVYLHKSIILDLTYYELLEVLVERNNPRKTLRCQGIPSADEVSSKLACQH